MSLVHNEPPLNLSPTDKPPQSSVGGFARPNDPRAETASVTPSGDEAAPPQNASAVMLSVQSDLKSAEPEWRAFEQTAERTAFQTFDWVSQWQIHIGGLRGTMPVIVAGRSTDGALLFLLPLAIEPGRLANQLTWLASDLCDYNAPLLAPSFAGLHLDWPDLWQHILQAIRAEKRFRFDLVDLAKMPEKVGAQANPMLTLGVTRHPDDAHVATLATDWDAFYRAKRSSSTRKVQRKHLNRLAEHGELRFVDDRDPASIARTLVTLMEQKRRALARMGVSDMFARPGMRDFYTAVANDPHMAGRIHVSRLDIGPDVGAASIGLLHDGRYYLILSSYNDGPLSNHGPGRAHLHDLLRYAIEHGYKEFDFTIGNEPYKLDWSDVRVALYDHLSAASLRGSIVKPAIAAYVATKRFIKNNPAAWHLFETLRSRVGGKRGAKATGESAGGEAE